MKPYLYIAIPMILSVSPPFETIQQNRHARTQSVVMVTMMMMMSKRHGCGLRVVFLGVLDARIPALMKAGKRSRER